MPTKVYDVKKPVTQTEPSNRLEIAQLKPGDKLSRISYMEVKSVSYDGIVVANEAGLEWSISNNILQQECHTANQVLETRNVSRTEAIEIFRTIGQAIFTVNFNKQPKLEDVLDKVLNKGTLKKNETIKKEVTEGMRGEERTLVGYILKYDVSWGRAMVVDLEQKDKKDRIRQVDQRTINWLICRNVKYIVD